MIMEKDRQISQLQQDAAELGRKLAAALLSLEESERLRLEAEARAAELEAENAAQTPEPQVAANDTLELMLALAMNTSELNKQRKAQVAAVKVELTHAEKERDDALAAVEALRKEIAELEAAAQAAKFADGKKGAQIAELAARIVELEKALAKALADVAMLSDALAAAQEAARQAALDAAAQGCAQEDAAPKAAAEAAASNAAAAAAAIPPKPATPPPPPPDLSGEVAAAAAENEALKARIGELMVEIERLTEALRKSNDALEAAEAKNDSVPGSNDDALRALRASMVELMAALAEAQAEAARLRRLNDQLEAALLAAGLQPPGGTDAGTGTGPLETNTVTETVIDEAEIERLNASEIMMDLRNQLREALEQVSFQWKDPDFLLRVDFRLKNVDFIIKQLDGAKRLIAQLQASQDDDDIKRIEWEKEKREELKPDVIITSEKGSQTDSEEARLQLQLEMGGVGSEREISRVTHDERARHKPRFLVPEKADVTHQKRAAKPLRWLLRLIRSLYDDK